MGLKSHVFQMFVLYPRAGLHFIQSPTAIREALKSINANEHAMMRQCRLKDRGNSGVCNKSFCALDGLSIVVPFRVDQYPTRPEEPSFDADLGAHTFDCAGERFH